MKIVCTHVDMLLSTEDSCVHVDVLLLNITCVNVDMLLPTEDICVHVEMLLLTEDSMLICCYLLRNLY